MTAKKTKTALLTAAFLISGCAVGPDYVAPQPEVPDLWTQSIESDTEDSMASLSAWWDAFDDDTLASLIRRAHSGNLSIDLFAERVTESRLNLAIAASERLPTVNASGGVERRRGSDGVSAAPPQQTRTDTFRDLGTSASWEIDLWGRVRRSVESARAAYESSIEELRDVQVSVYAEVATSYFLLRTQQERLRLARANVVTQQRTLELVTARHEAELTPLLDVRQAELNLAVTQSSIPELEAAIANILHQISFLLGEMPAELSIELSAPQPMPDIPETFTNQVPANVVRQRPDIRAAERQLAAQTAQIGVATADLYPNFFLSGDFGYSTASGGLVNQANRSWGLGTAFSLNLFNSGRVRNSIRVEEARTRQAFISYEQTVLDALREVENSLVDYHKEVEKSVFLGVSVDAAVDAERLVTDQYRQGLTNFQNVLDTQRSLFNQQDQLADSKGSALIDLVSVYRSFGGGWDAFPTPTAEDSK